MRSRPIPAPAYWAMISRPLEMLACVSKERRASTSVETRPGIIFRMRLPNSTARWSKASEATFFGSADSPSVLRASKKRSVDDLLVLRHLGGGGDERWVGGGIPRLELFDGFDVAGVGYNHCHFPKLFENGGHTFRVAITLGRGPLLRRQPAGAAGSGFHLFAAVNAATPGQGGCAPARSFRDTEADRRGAEGSRRACAGHRSKTRCG